jgi:hypothetical protein
MAIGEISAVYLATKKLLEKQPEWAPTITACVQLAEEDGAFWSSGALNRAQHQRRSLVPLRILGLLERVEKGTRNNHDASYRMRDPEAVKRALVEKGIDPEARLSGDFYDLHNKAKLKGASPTASVR